MEANALHLRGRRVGDFVFGDELGQGGMGTAYRAEQVTLRREVVIKVITTDSVSEDHKVRFLREARLASRLDHPYAAHVYAFGAEPDGLLWIAMELVRGVPLDQLVADLGPLPLARFVPIFDRLCEVVHSAHEQGIIHRDIKPSNVMVVRRAGRLLPKLLDFGIARAAASVELAPRDGPAPGADTLEGALDGAAELDQPGRSVTVQGRVVGLPPYMAPEQWVDATRADARTDLYALGVTAYELLTGRLPFTGSTAMAIARAHARTEAAPLGRGLPAALDRVLARALAKRAAQRYDDVLAFAAAVREAARDADGAAGHGGDLDEVVRDAFVAGAPQPVAEALLQLAGARTPQAAWEEIGRVLAVVLRCLGAIALAARARIGERGAADAAAPRIRALIERGLDLDEWAALVAELLAPFATRPQTHPVPDLVAVCWQDGAPRAVFEPLLALRRRGMADEIGPELVDGALAELGQVLRACTVLTEYPWAVATAAGGESWVGPRRLPRERRGMPAYAPGSTWLLDADGGPVLELSPIVTVAPPAPGADDEAFIVDGPARRGARSVAWPREFERHDEPLRAFVDHHIATLGDRAAAAEDEERAPYRGLATFGPGDAAMFFGREREVEAVVNRLRVHPLIAVVGPSGVGKSSFVHAGLVPALPEAWQALTVRPGASPLAALEARLAAAGVTVTGLADRLRDDPDALRVAVETAARQLGARLVLVIDQLEEMFTQCRDAAIREAFGRALAAAATRGDAPARVILTLRDDFLVRAAELPGLGDRLATGLELLTLPDPDTLRRILVEPLARVGYAFEDPALPDTMVAAVRDHPGALALVSFAAAKLWELRDRRFRHVPNKAYDAIGGVAGALARHAEDTLSALAEDDRGLVRELFRHLVTSEGTRAVLRRDEALELLGKSAAAERVIEALVERRLLVGYEGDGGTDWLEVIHEALLTAWPRLVTWQREDAEGARLRDQLRAAARQWGERGRQKGLLWRGEALVEYRLWRSRHGGALTDLERAFADASVADDTRARRARRIAVGAVIVGLTIGLIVLQRANHAAERNAAASRRTALALLAEQGRAALVANKPQDAMVYLSAAYARGADDPNLRFLLGVTGRALGGELATLRGHTAGVKAVAASADGTRVFTAGLDGTVRVWDAQRGAELRSFVATGTSAFAGLGVTARGDLLTYGADERPRVWDVATGTPRFELATAAGAAARIALDGAAIVSVAPDDAVVRIWNAADGSARGAHAESAVLQPPLLSADGDRYAAATTDGVIVGGLDGDAPAVRFSLGGPPRLLHLGAGGTRLLAARDQSREILVWDVARPAAPHVLAGHAGDVLGARFSPDGTRIASTSLDHTAKIWDAETGRLMASLDGHDGYVLPVNWSPDGTLVATGSIDRTTRLWDGHTGAPRAIFYGHSDIVFRLEFDHSGQHLFSASFDGTARIFSTRPPADAAELHHGGGPVAVRFSADGRRLLAVGHDGAAWVFDVAQRAVVAELLELRTPTQLSRLDAMARRKCGDLDATGETVVIPLDQTARVIRLADRAHPVTIGPHPGPASCALFGPGGRVVIGGDDGTITIWSAAGVLERSLAAHTAPITDLDLDPATGRLVSGAIDGTAAVFDLATGARITGMTGGNGSTNGVAIGHDGRMIATAGQDTVARVFDVATARERAASHGMSDLQDVDVSPDDRRIAVANTEGTATIYDVDDGRLLARFGDTTGWATGVDFSPDGALLAVGDDAGRVRLWNVSEESRSPAEVSAFVECQVPFALVDNHLVARTIGASCR